MKLTKSTRWALAIFCLALLSLGVDKCDPNGAGGHLLAKIRFALAGHETRIDRLEACECCCDGRFELACGSDGTTYLNPCEAACAGVDVVHAGRCDPEPACSEPNPAGCIQTGCPDGEVCSVGDACIPSACRCDEATGTWGCTADCGGGECTQPNPGCTEPNPAGCSQTGCPTGEVCFRDGTECNPSLCQCDLSTGTWTCTDDCGGGGQCIGSVGSCTDPNPAGCSQTGCPDGQVCFRDGTGCSPSLCQCDPSNATWICTDDCGGGGQCISTSP